MKEFPSVPHASNAPEAVFEEGHLWILEKIDGAPLRFQLQDSGLVHFGDRHRVYDDPAAVPEPYQHAVRYVRESLDRRALRAAVDDVERVVFFGEATHYHTIDYDWDRLPSFLGFDVWSADEGEFLTPDAVEQVFERLDLQPVNAIERELPTRDFHPDRFTVPKSAWYDGPAEGVVVRNKRGGRATLLHPDFRDREPPAPVDASAEAFAERCATDRRFERIATALEERDEPVAFDALYDHTIEAIARQEYARLYHDADPVEMDAFRSAVAALTRSFLDDWRRRES
jgi:hypothetical protein